MNHIEWSSVASERSLTIWFQGAEIPAVCQMDANEQWVGALIPLHRDAANPTVWTQIFHQTAAAILVTGSGSIPDGAFMVTHHHSPDFGDAVIINRLPQALDPLAAVAATGSDGHVLVKRSADQYLLCIFSLSGPVFCSTIDTFGGSEGLHTPGTLTEELRNLCDAGLSVGR